MMATGTGTSGGQGGTSGAQRRLALLLAAGFAVILLAVMLANAESTMSDFAASGIHETNAHVWIWEATSMIAWITVMPAIWWLVRRARPPRMSWIVVGLLVVAASVPVSLWHIGLMVALRKLAYAAASEQYRFFGVVDDRLLYEYRKDFASYLQFAAIAAIVQWLLARAVTPAAVPDAVPRTLVVPDGAVTHQVPVDEIDHVAAAGNYVEIAWGGRILLHRATLAAVEEALGAGFARIHRGRLVRRAAIRRIETDRSGDFTVALEDGVTLRGSRRYRAGLQEPL
jgi:DNA-binding LytR/AlgR family response regulator